MRRSSASKTSPSAPQFLAWHALGQLPVHAEVEEQLEFAVRCAILAPSSHNSQPWRFRRTDAAIELLADRSRVLPVVDPDHRELTMSCGAALFHLRVAVRMLGREALVERCVGRGDPELVARVQFGPPVEPTDDGRRLFDAIPQRHTNRQPFERRSLPRRLLDELSRAVRDEGATLTLMSVPDWKGRLAGLIAEGDRRQWDDKGFRAELAAWTRPNHSRSGDGIPGYGIGHGELSSIVGPLVVRTFDLGDGQAARDRDLAEHSPALAVLLTDSDEPPDWLAAGEALGHLLLRGQAAGVSASFLNQPIEVAALRAQVRELTEEQGFPQLVLRLGYPREPGRLTPRRPLTEVLI